MHWSRLFAAGLKRFWGFTRFRYAAVAAVTGKAFAAANFGVVFRLILLRVAGVARSNIFAFLHEFFFLKSQRPLEGANSGCGPEDDNERNHGLNNDAFTFGNSFRTPARGEPNESAVDEKCEGDGTGNAHNQKSDIDEDLKELREPAFFRRGRDPGFPALLGNQLNGADDARRKR